ncbi:hypothetical protein [Actinomadura sp. WMMA1423]|uniref:hypothetical protein n=1 Tax=Actinomadura sp. WMMA1423 TaxID=2591108 RepID=UPI00197A8E94|nr:hypothetical protein [Actinomadura sp. WMMA1423]
MTFLIVAALGVLAFGGVFAAITYIAPMMTGVSGFAESSVTWLLVVLGLGMVAGNLGGRYADRRLMPMLYTALGGLALVLLLFTFLASGKSRPPGVRSQIPAATLLPGLPVTAMRTTVG